MKDWLRGFWILGLSCAAGAGLSVSGCRSAATHRADADRVGMSMVERSRGELVPGAEPFVLERPSDTFRRELLSVQGLPTVFAEVLTNETGRARAPDSPMAAHLTLVDSLRIGFANSREYQDAKEDVFKAALDLDLKSDAFRSTFAGLISGSYSDNRSGGSSESGSTVSFEPGVTRRLKSGAELSAKLALDVASLLSGESDSAFGILADVSMTVPLLRGAGREVVMEPLTQAERNLVYSIYQLERFKRSLAVDSIRSYYAALEQEARLANQEENLRGIALATRRAEELGKAGRVSEIQVNLSKQNELSAQDRLAVAKESTAARIDQFKVSLGLPTDAAIKLDPADLEALALPADGASLAEAEAIRRALGNRFDLHIAQGRVEDARRGIRVAEDALRAGMDLVLSGTSGERRAPGSASRGDAELRIDSGSYRAGLGLQLPWERKAERNAYRQSLLSLDAAVRSAEAAEDKVKIDVRSAFRSLRQSMESCAIQEQALTLARRRVESTELLLEAGRAEMRDLVEARDSLLQAQNAVLSARIAYRMAELELSQSMETLRITDSGVMGDEHAP